MASDLWTLSVNGGSYTTLHSRGIEAAVVTKASFAVGSLVFRVPTDDLTAAAPFAYGDTLRLKRDTVIHFVGRVRQQVISFNAAEAAWTVSAFDSWWEMERTIYRQPRAMANATFTGLVGFMSTRVSLGLNAWGQAISQDKQIENSMAYGAAMNPGIFSLAAAPALDSLAAEETQSITIAESIRRSAAQSLVGSGYFDYSAGAAAMTIAQRASLGLVTLDLAAANLITDVTGLRRRDDLIPPGVIFDFEQTVLDGDDKPHSKITRQAAGSPGAAGTIIALFKLGECDTIPSGAAAAYHTSLNTAQWEGTLQTMALECPGTIKPGTRLNLASGQPAWATMNAVVQRTVEELDHGLTTIEVGPAEVLGQDDFVDRLIRLRNRPAPTAYCQTQNNGTAGVATGIDDTGTPTTPDANSGISNPATGNAPTGSPVANPSAGIPPQVVTVANAMGIDPADFTGFAGVNITLCDATPLTVIVKRPA